MEQENEDSLEIIEPDNILSFNKLAKDVADELVEFVEDVDNFIWTYLSSLILFEWEGLPVNEDMNIEEFFKDVVACELLKPELWEKNCCGKYVTFKLLNDINNEPAVKTINAFELMRTTSMLNYLPEFKLPAKNSWEQLRIDLNELIRTSGGGWIGKDNANNIGKKFVSDLTKSIWYVDSYIKNQENHLTQKNCEIIIKF
ncbi:hypothetical protein C1645_829978 [Glomus cerebriforme]|uniref:Uncharacterized protein n=1 Tax=Glomus cerebriforme TaxID=658196 RepID=A0A397STG8_9GLOM|nr:hypothetical protein C1645_829978 [Glomus cerebriforme]